MNTNTIKTNIEGYFNTCRDSVKRQWGWACANFLALWVANAVPEYENYDKFVFYFAHEGLHKVDAIVDRKIIKSFSGEAWLNPPHLLDTKDPTIEAFTEEFDSNEEDFMNYIRFSDLAVPISDSEFIVVITPELANGK